MRVCEAHRPLPIGAQRGFSLLELVVAIVVLGLMFGGFVSVYATVMRQSSDPQLQLQALAIAEAYLNEAASRSFRDPDTAAICAGSEAQRPLFDDVCDYHALPFNGCIATSAICPQLGTCACDRFGQPLDGLRGFDVAFDVVPMTLSGVSGLRLRVGVSHAGLIDSGATLQTFRAED